MTPIPVMPDLHTAGPYLFISGGPSILFELDGSGRRQLTRPSDKGYFSPDKKWYAFITGGFDDKGELLKEGMILHIANAWTGVVRDIANLIPQDYIERQEQMVEKFIKEENATREYVDVEVGLFCIYAIPQLIT